MYNTWIRIMRCEVCLQRGYLDSRCECGGTGVIYCCEGTDNVYGGVEMINVKQTKHETGYTNNTTDLKERCALCMHYESPNSCNKVMGIINPGGWCRLFKRLIGVVR